MKARYMLLKSETIITLTKETYNVIASQTTKPMDMRQTTFHDDGTVSIAIHKTTLERLRRLDTNVELAIRKLFKLKAH